MTVKILHNPRCSKSRKTLQLLHDRGIEPEIIDYLNHPPSAELLTEIIQKLGITPRQLMRQKETEYKTTGMDNPELNDIMLIQGMIETPKLIERPIVMANDQVAIGRPPENVLAIL